jgi:ribonuclease J
MNSKLLKWMQEKGFCMLVRPTEKFNDYLKFLEPQLDRNEAVLIYSMWKEYINQHGKHANKRYLDFVGKFPSTRNIHTSSHASAD